MKVSFPNFGYDTPAMKTFVEDMGAVYVPAPPGSKRRWKSGGQLAGTHLPALQDNAG